MISVSIHFTTRPEKKTEFEQVVQALKDKIASEKGSLGCRVYRNVDSPNEFMVIEQWEDESHARDHLKSENMAVLCGTRGLLTNSARVALNRHPSPMDIEKNFAQRFDRRAFVDHRKYRPRQAE